MKKILIINPGATSTKSALYIGKEKQYASNVEFPKDLWENYPKPGMQVDARMALVEQDVLAHGFKMEEIDVFMGRSGGFSCGAAAGAYEVNEAVMAVHPLETMMAGSELGCHMVKGFADKYGGKAMVINDASIDEFQDVTRVTGVKGVWRSTAAHSLNQKAAAELAAESVGKQATDLNMVVAHLGGGISIGAHCHGRMIDTTNLLGDGPMSANRSGALSVADVCGPILKGKMSAGELMKKCLGNGTGLLGHLGTTDGREVEQMIADGNEYAKLIYDGMIYQIAQSIARMAIAMKGQVDYIVMTGGLANSRYIQTAVQEYCGWIAPTLVFAGEYEAEAMVSTALKVLDGTELLRIFDNIPVFDTKRFN